MSQTIGILSYKNPERLRATIASIRQHTVGDYRLLIVHNPADGPEDTAARIVIDGALRGNDKAICLPQNIGYAGGVNELILQARFDHEGFLLYVENDVEIRTPGWNTLLLETMRMDDRIGQVFPGSGHFGMHNGRYNECLWNAGYCWALRLSAVDEMPKHPADQGCFGLMDPRLGHHEEVDYMIRLRLSGYLIAADPRVSVIHHETSTRSAESEQRIHDGVVRWMNKWNRYFAGDVLQYSMTAYDPRCLRYTDWPPGALYLERYFLHHMGQINKAPEVATLPSGPMDLIKVPKPLNCYHERII